MMNQTLKIILPITLLITAFIALLFGGGLLIEGYGLKRNKVLVSPQIVSTSQQYTSIEDLKGQVSYLTFGFSNCTNTCPITLAQYKKIAEILPAEAQFIFVSVDEERDTIRKLSAFLAEFNPNIIGWKLHKDDLADFASQFDTHLNRNGQQDIEHGSSIQVIDENGRWVKTYPYLKLDEAKVLADYRAISTTNQNL